MERLIEITNVPVEIEMKISPARLEYTRSTAEFEISHEGGKLNIKSRPIRVNIDSFEARNSIVPTPARAIKQNAVKGQEAVYEATASYARQGQLLLTTKLGQELVTQFAKESVEKNIKMNVGIDFIPREPIQMDWDPGELNIRFEIDKLNIDWRINKGSFEFTPGDIEITMTQRPDVIIKYLGGPLLVDNSSNPNYQSVDLLA